MDPIFGEPIFGESAFGESAFGESRPGEQPGGAHDASAGDLTPADDLDSHLWMQDEGRIWDLGPAEVDTDNDGVNDSLTRNGPDGFTVYTDSDRDGQVDKITEINANGDFRSAVLNPETGTWVPTDSGRLN